MAKVGVIIVAGGSGRRMGGSVPKQFMKLCGRPVLMHTIERFVAVADHIVVALSPSEKVRWSELVGRYGFNVPHTVVEGGAARFYSVKNALSEMADCDYIGVHDGVRPLVSKEIIYGTLAAAISAGAAIPAVEVTDSLREVGDDPSKGNVVDRSRLRAVQTPQFFRADILLEAYQAPYEECFTDDASVVEAAGHKITLVRGDNSNIKITTPIDLIIAAAILQNERAGVRN